MADNIGHLFYFVTIKRADNTTPKLVKAFDGNMFFLVEDATKYAVEKEKELGLKEGTLKVFSAVAYID